MRGLMAAGTCAYGLAAAVMLFSPSGPRSDAAIAATVVTVVFAEFASAYWVARWPSLRTSRAIVIASGLGLITGCLAQSSPTAGLLGATGFTVLACYVAVFHGPRLLTVVIAVGSATTLTCAVRLAAQGDPAMALSILPVTLVAMVGLPLVSQVLVRLLGVDAHRSGTDALTGLLNRHGFHSAATDLANKLADTGNGRLTVAMIDLDKFKHVNDTLGHTVGDQILVAVGAALQEAAGEDALVVRLGGEEFLVAEVWPSRRSDLGDRILDAFARLDHRVTASIGLESATVLPRDEAGFRAALDGMLASADAAMYAAKRAGGNAVREAVNESVHASVQESRTRDSAAA